MPIQTGISLTAAPNLRAFASCVARPSPSLSLSPADWVRLGRLYPANVFRHPDPHVARWRGLEACRQLHGPHHRGTLDLGLILTIFDVLPGSLPPPIRCVCSTRLRVRVYYRKLIGACDPLCLIHFTGPIQVVLSWRGGGRWFSQMWKVDHFVAENTTLIFDPTTGGQGGEGMTDSGQWWIENVLEECDSPNEFFFDEKYSWLGLDYFGPFPPAVRDVPGLGLSLVRFPLPDESDAARCVRKARVLLGARLAIMLIGASPIMSSWPRFGFRTKDLYYFFNDTADMSADLVATQTRVLFNMTGTMSAPVKDVTIRGITMRDTRITYLDAHGMPSGMSRNAPPPHWNSPAVSVPSPFVGQPRRGRSRSLPRSAHRLPYLTRLSPPPPTHTTSAGRRG